MEEPFAKRAKVELESVDANSVISFHLLRKVDGQIVMEEVRRHERPKCFPICSNTTQAHSSLAHAGRHLQSRNDAPVRHVTVGIGST